MIENTSQRDPMLHLLGTAGPGGQTRYIEEMEAAGQRQVVNNAVIPTRAPDAELAALGFVLGDPVDGDRLFRHVTLPDGWAKEGSDHSMWSYIVDQHGRRRVSVFYKAAFYDRDAFASIKTLASYVADVIRGEAKLTIDDEWATPRALCEAAEAEIARMEKSIAEYQEPPFAGDPYWAKELVKQQAEIRQYRTFLARPEVKA
jgi:hypothetical protein